MPRRSTAYRVARLANFKRATFECPHCGQDNTVMQDYLLREPFHCRACKQPFVALVFEHHRAHCDLCKGKFLFVHYREYGGKVLAICQECVEAFDTFTEMTWEEQSRWLGNFANYLREPQNRRGSLRQMRRTIRGYLSQGS